MGKEFRDKCSNGQYQKIIYKSFKSVYFESFFIKVWSVNYLLQNLQLLKLLSLCILGMNAVKALQLILTREFWNAAANEFLSITEQESWYFCTLTIRVLFAFLSLPFVVSLFIFICGACLRPFTFDARANKSLWNKTWLLFRTWAVSPRKSLPLGNELVLNEPGSLARLAPTRHFSLFAQKCIRQYKKVTHRAHP